MEERQITIASHGAVRLVCRNDLKGMPSRQCLLAIVILAACGIAVLSWPLVESREDQIEVWMEQNRFLIASVFLSAIAIVARAVKQIAESDEETRGPQRPARMEWRNARPHRSGGPPSAA
jgi:hypothetical protein